MSPSRWAVDVAGPVQALLPVGFVVVALDADVDLEVRAPSGVSVRLDSGVARRGASGAPRAYAVRDLAARAAVRFRTLAEVPELRAADESLRPAYAAASELLAPLRDGGAR